jgi:hypothetical protein
MNSEKETMDIPQLAYPHDHLAKHFLANVDLTADFLKNYVAREVVDKLDLGRLRIESPVKVIPKPREISVS